MGIAHSSGSSLFFVAKNMGGFVGHKRREVEYEPEGLVLFQKPSRARGGLTAHNSLKYSKLWQEVALSRARAGN